MIILETQNLTKSYSGIAALNNFSLRVEQGDILGLIGQNGAGKTTLMRLIASLSYPDSGDISLFEKSSASDLIDARKRIGSIIEMPALFPNLSALQNLEYYRLQRGIPDKSAPQKALEITGLTDAGKKKFRNFSLGMKQRLGLALAILNHPDFIMMDEPINGLDPMGIIEMRKTIQRLHQQGITILISSHILNELSQTATKYAIIHQGRLVKSITQEQLQEECKRALSVVVDDPSKAAVILEAELNIFDYKRIGTNELRVYGQLNHSAEITFKLNSGGVRVSSMHEVGDNLEDYFMKIIHNQNHVQEVK